MHKVHAQYYTTAYVYYIIWSAELGKKGSVLERIIIINI